MDVLKRQLLVNIFDILVRQGLLTEEENNRLKLELADQAGRGRNEHAESRNI